MAPIGKLILKRAFTGKALTAVALSMIALGGRPILAQDPGQGLTEGPLSGQEIASAESSHALGARLYAVADEAAGGVPSAPTDAAPPADDQWHIGFAPYLW